MKAFIVDITEMEMPIKAELLNYAEDYFGYFGNHTFQRIMEYDQDEFSEEGVDQIPLTRAWVQDRNKSNLPVFVFYWW